jgi:hypothetical protein
MEENLKFDLKIDGLQVYMNWKGNAAKNIAKHIRTVSKIERGNIVNELSKMFKCNVKKDTSATIYILTFNSERDMIFFTLHI